MYTFVYRTRFEEAKPKSDKIKRTPFPLLLSPACYTNLCLRTEVSRLQKCASFSATLHNVRLSPPPPPLSIPLYRLSMAPSSAEEHGRQWKTLPSQLHWTTAIKAISSMLTAHWLLINILLSTLHSPPPHHPCPSTLTDDLATAGATANVFIHNWANLSRQHRKCTEFLAIAQASLMILVYHIL